MGTDFLFVSPFLLNNMRSADKGYKFWSDNSLLDSIISLKEEPKPNWTLNQYLIFDAILNTEMKTHIKDYFSPILSPNFYLGCI